MVVRWYGGSVVTAAMLFVGRVRMMSVQWPAWTDILRSLFGLFGDFQRCVDAVVTDLLPETQPPIA